MVNYENAIHCELNTIRHVKWGMFIKVERDKAVHPTTSTSPILSMLNSLLYLG